jgi:ferredoxin
MGIDVMNYANKGIPMNDVECVRCSTCVTSCPMEVLSFEKMMESDPENKARPSVPDYGKDDWRAGIK